MVKMSHTEVAEHIKHRFIPSKPAVSRLSEYDSSFLTGVKGDKKKKNNPTISVPQTRLYSRQHKPRA